METISVDGLTVVRAVPERPTRAPLLFVHGYFADARVWALMLPWFAARGYPCYAVNLRGRAGSRMDVDLGRVTLREFADDAEAVARTLGVPVVIGHSMGGLVAQLVAARGAARGLVLFAPAPPRGIPVLTLRLAMAQLRYLPAMLTSRVVVPGRAEMRMLAMNRVPSSEQEELLDRLVPDSGTAGREMGLAGVPVDRERVRVPMVVFGGDRDRFIPISRVRRVARRYGAAFSVAPGRGHMLVLEPDWQVLAQQTADWMESAL